MFLYVGDNIFIRSERITHIVPNGEGLRVYVDAPVSTNMHTMDGSPIPYTSYVDVPAHLAIALKRCLVVNGEDVQMEYGIDEAPPIITE